MAINNAVNAGFPFNQIAVQVFTSSGTYTPTSGMRYCIVECVGGGGGSGAVPDTTAPSAVASSAGGGGGYCRKTFNSTQVTSATVNIGSAGTGGISPNGNGGNGGNTTFIASPSSITLTASGGSGGSSNTAQTALGFNGVGGGGGGGASGGDVNIAGQKASDGSYTIVSTSPFFISASGSVGGSSMLGKGGAWKAPGSSNYASASGFGAGAGSNVSFNQAASAGGNGTQGIVIITEFLT